MFKDEVAVIDRLGNETGSVGVEEAHRKGLWHQAVYIYATDGTSVMQRRVLEDPRARGGTRPVWDMSLLMGDVLVGETPEETVERIAREARLKLRGLRRLQETTLTESRQKDAQGRPYCHRTVDCNFAIHCSSLPKTDDRVTRLYPIASLINDTCYSLRHAASFEHAHRGSHNRETYKKILAILAKYGKR